MPKNKILEATNGIVGILDSLKTEDRRRVIAAALTVLGEQPIPDGTVARDGRVAAKDLSKGGTDSRVTEKAYLDQKDPQTKGEELAAAACFREEHLDAAESSKEDLRTVLKAARRNFDSGNYHRDLDNARVSGLFNRGTGKDAAVLSHYGQNYIDALPDREAARALPRPKGAGRRSTGRRLRRKPPVSKTWIRRRRSQVFPLACEMN